ncbi:MAG: hypothetical protein J6X88_08070 [Bacteroidales bacterium]|nr:hypothetical protein [Bacteroidales bacterium]
MSTERCPKCGSTDTRPAYWNYVGKGLKVAAGFAFAIFAPNTMFGKVGPSNVIKEEIDKHYCKNCGHEW